jgi:biopolymer transport protein ExbB
MNAKPKKAHRMRTRTFALGLALWALASGGAHPSSLMAQATSSPAPNHQPAAAEAPRGQTFIDLVLAGGMVGHAIIGLSILALALAIDHAWKIRAAVLMPPGLADKVRGFLQAGQLAQAQQQCKLQSSLLASVLSAGLSEIDAGWSAAEKTMEDLLAEQAARLFRRVEYLAVIGNLAPLLGLLGTVTGMLVTIRQIVGAPQDARRELADSLYLTLVPTVEGLIVAIFCLCVFVLLRNRVEELMAEVAHAGQHAFQPLRQGRTAAPRRTSPLPPPVEGRT